MGMDSSRGMKQALVFEAQTESERTAESLDVNNFAVKVVGGERGVRGEQLSFQEEGRVLRVGFGDLWYSVEYIRDRGETLEPAGFRSALVSEKDRGVNWAREGGTMRRHWMRNAELAQPDVPEVPDGKVGANLGGRDEVKGF